MLLRRCSTRLCIAGLSVLLAVATTYSWLPTGTRWRATDIPVHVVLSLGSQWTSAVRDALDEWNGAGARFSFRSATTSVREVPSCSEPDYRNIVVFSTSHCGMSWGPGTLAVAHQWFDSSDNHYLDVDVIFNSNYQWDIYRGPRRPGVIDLRRVAIHEFGHMLGLDHPNRPGQSVRAIMNSTVTDVDTVQADDIAGALGIYGRGRAPVPPPPPPPPPRPGRSSDLDVRALRASPTTLVAGQLFTLSVTVQNVGDRTAQATTLSYRRRTKSGEGDEVGSTLVDELPGGRTSHESIELTAPAEPGAYDYWACAYASGDINPSNNCSNVATVTIDGGLPDLVFGLTFLNRYNILPGKDFAFFTSIVNAGAGGSDSTTLVYQGRSRGGQWTEVGRDVVSPLAPLEESDEVIILTVSEDEGAFEYRACLLSGIEEDIDRHANRCTRVVELTVSANARSCTQDLGTLFGTVTRLEDWLTECRSVHYDGFSRYYSFTLNDSATIEISMQTNQLFVSRLALWTGAGMGEDLVAVDVYDFYDLLNDLLGYVHRINRRLPAGTYTIEAMTDSPILPFRLTVGFDGGGSGGGNQPPVTLRSLPDRLLELDSALEVDVSRSFYDPEGEGLNYRATSSATQVVTVRATGGSGRVWLTAVGVGVAEVLVMATDGGGLSATQAFAVTVPGTVPSPFTDYPIEPGVTHIKAVHFTELRTVTDAVRVDSGLRPFAWTDQVLVVGVTPVKLVHLLELRSAIGEAYVASGRSAPSWTDPRPTAGLTAIRAVHLRELRAALMAVK